jgi:hypothetical protein
MTSKTRKSKTRKSKARKSLRTKNKQKSRCYRKKSRRIIKTQSGGDIKDLTDLVTASYEPTDSNYIGNYSPDIKNNPFITKNTSVRDRIIDIAAHAAYFDEEFTDTDKKYLELSNVLSTLYTTYGKDNTELEVRDITEQNVKDAIEDFSNGGDDRIIKTDLDIFLKALQMGEPLEK